LAGANGKWMRLRRRVGEVAEKVAEWAQSPSQPTTATKLRPLTARYRADQHRTYVELLGTAMDDPSVRVKRPGEVRRDPQEARLVPFPFDAGTGEGRGSRDRQSSSTIQAEHQSDSERARQTASAPRTSFSAPSVSLPAHRPTDLVKIRAGVRCVSGGLRCCNVAIRGLPRHPGA
jgi:hypothetical protein